MLSVTGAGAFELGPPVFQVGFGEPRDWASGFLVPVPEAAVDEDDGLMARERQVRRTRQVAPVQAEAVAKSVNHRADLHLGLHPPGADP